MSALVAFIKGSLSVRWATVIISALPIIELRGGIPFAVAMGLEWYEAMMLAIIGNIVPIPFVILLIKPVLNFLRKRKCFEPIVRWQERKMEKHSKKVAKYSMLGLFMFVAIPIPGTGAWTGAMVADFLNIKTSDAIVSIFFGVLCASVLVTVASMGIVSGLEWIL